MSCAGKPAMERDAPDDSNEYSDEGTCAHAVSAQSLSDGTPVDSFVGTQHPLPHGRSYEFREDMVVPTQAYVEAVLARMAEYTLAGATSVQLMVEQRVPIGHITGEEDASGTADAVIVVMWPDGTALLDVGDLKFGRGVQVSAYYNKQLMLYALGTIKMLEPVTDFTRVRMTVYQPRVNDKPSDFELPIAELLAFADEVKVAAQVALKVYGLGRAELRPYLVASTDACRFCKAKQDCPALDAVVTNHVASFESMADIDPADGKAHDAITLQATTDDAAALAAKMRACNLIEDWIKAIRSEVERRLLNGDPIPGYKLVQGRQGARAWADKAAAEDYMKGKVRLQVDEMYHKTLISPTEAEKLVAAKAKGERGIGPAQWTVLQNMITRSPGGKSVAPDTDKRPAIVVGAEAEAFDTANAEDLV